MWLEDEGRYEYTQQYFDLREKAFIVNRFKMKEQQKQRLQILKDTHPNLWKSKSVKKRRHTRLLHAR